VVVCWGGGGFGVWGRVRGTKKRGKGRERDRGVGCCRSARGALCTRKGRRGRHESGPDPRAAMGSRGLCARAREREAYARERARAISNRSARSHLHGIVVRHRCFFFFVLVAQSWYCRRARPGR
jgi:hypothetical protein